MLRENTVSQEAGVEVLGCLQSQDTVRDLNNLRQLAHVSMRPCPFSWAAVCIWTQMAQQKKHKHAPPAQQKKELDVVALHTSLQQPQQSVFIQPKLFALD